MKHKGGKGKKAPYSTVVMRIPTPIEQDVRRLVEEFFSKGVTGIEDKGVTDIEDKGVTAIDDKGVTAIDDKGVTGKTSDESGIETLNFPNRLYNRLKRYQINTIGDLKALGYTIEEVPGVGKKSIWIIKDALAANNVLKP